jgi:hypothetical protein
MIGELIQGMLRETFEGASDATKQSVAGAYNLSFLGSVTPKLKGP